MKNWIAILLALDMALSLCACGGNGGNDGEKEEPKKVTASLLTEFVAVQKEIGGDTVTMKALLEYDDDYYVIGTKVYEDDTMVMEITYDKNPGKPLLQQDYKDGKKTSRREYTYDESGNTLMQYCYNAAGEIEWGYTYVYDADGNQLSEKCYDLDGLTSEYTCTYDSNGNLLTAATTWPTNPDEYRMVYTYNELGDRLTQGRYVNGQETESISYDHIYTDGKLVVTTAYTDGKRIHMTQYDSDGNKVLECDYHEGNESYRTEYTYENGKLVKQAGYSDGEERSKYLCVYNDDGKLTERVVYYEGAVDNRLICTYNETGDAVHIQSYNETMGDIEYTITYQSVTVSKEEAKRIAQLNASLELY